MIPGRRRSESLAVTSPYARRADLVSAGRRYMITPGTFYILAALAAKPIHLTSAGSVL